MTQHLSLPSGLSIQQAGQKSRVLRSPSHQFYVETKPFGIYPFCLAPVLPGETLKNLQMQSRVVTDPVVSPLVGWWAEYYFFYVKLRDLGEAVKSAVETMILNPTDPSAASLSGIVETDDDVRHYFAPGAGSAVNWVERCLNKVVEDYFRDEDESATTYMYDGVPLAKFNQKAFWESLFYQSEIDTGTLPTDAQDFTVYYEKWLWLRQNKMVDMTFEQYLETFGVRAPGGQIGKCELIRFVRDWSYPSNTVDPSSGAPTSAVSWSVAERADKDRFFTEPGFVFGVTVKRPKTYCGHQTQVGSVMLDRAFNWLPAMLKDNPETSIFELGAASEGNNPTNQANVLLDVRDLFVHGDQFLRISNPLVDAIGDAHHMSGRAATHDGLTYPKDADIDDLFSDRSPAEKVWIREDGIVKLNILGTQLDMT